MTALFHFEDRVHRQSLPQAEYASPISTTSMPGARAHQVPGRTPIGASLRL